MKRITNKFLAGTLIAGFALLTSCADILDEQPRSEITPQLMQTNQGVELALTSVYSHLRFLYGPVNPWYNFQYGTDETTYGGLVGSGDDERRMDDYNIVATTGRPGCFWNSNTFAYINTCNGIISIGEANGVDSRLLAEARVMRAHDQFLLVQFYGGIPLDLGSGKNAYNTLPNRKSVRNTVEETYASIIEDLEKAAADLNGTKRDDRFKGVVTEAYASYLLSKVYLTYGWWLKNNNKSGSDGYFQKAYDTAMGVISKSGVNGAAGANGFGLLQDYYQVNLAQNDRNIEVLLYADRSDDAGFDFSEGESWGTEAEKSNIAFYAMRCWFDTSFNGGGAPCGRSALQDYGRPWRRCAPTYEVIANTFADKTNDSRYDGTFQKEWLANQNASTSNGALNTPFALGDVAYYMPGYEIAGASAPTKLASGNFPVQTIAGQNYAVFTPEYMTREHFPSLWKLGPYSPNNASGYANSSSLRPFNVAKLSEVYLIAAEAAVMGATGTKTARELINVLRERAAYRSANTEAQNETAKTNILAATPANIDIDYILDERSRELYGEQLRWADLVRTKKLSRAKTYSIRDYNADAIQPRNTITRPGLANIENEPDSKFYLRPIPQTFIDTLDMTEEEKKAYQNPGY